MPYGAVGVPPLPEVLEAAPTATVAEADRLIADGQPFRAHEVLEAAWKASPEAERGLWQGLAQVAVGLTHLQRGNARGAVALLTRGVVGLAAYQAAPPYGIDIAGVRARASALAEVVSAIGVTADPGLFRLRADPDGRQPDR